MFKKTLTFLLFSFCDGECFIDLLACIQDYMDTEAGSVRLPGWFNTVRNLSFGKDWPFQWLMPLRNNMLTGSHKHIRIHTCVEYIYIHIYIHIYIYMYNPTSDSRVPFRLSGPTLTTAHHSETPRPKDFSTQQSMRFNAWKMWDRFNHWRCISESNGLSISKVFAFPVEQNNFLQFKYCFWFRFIFPYFSIASWLVD